MTLVNISYTVGITGTTEANNEPEKKTDNVATRQREVDLGGRKNLK